MRARLLSFAIAIACLAVAPASTAADVAHTVEPGESLWSIAAVNGISAEALAAANDLSPDTQLIEGTTVQIPSGGGDSGSSDSTTSTVAHTVEPGESLWSIAAVNGIGVEELAAVNDLSPDTMLAWGSVIQVPAAGQGVGEKGGAKLEGCNRRCRVAAHPHPTDETVTPEQVGEVAARHGMSPSLIQAVAAQESGFENSAVSSEGARAVMQIIPSTWSFIEEHLVGQALPGASALANIEAGTNYLHHLYHLMSGDRKRTIGSYYQGPNRDRILPDTHRYIHEVLERQKKYAGAGG